MVASWNSSQIKELSFVYNLIQINLMLNTNKSKIKYIYVRLGIDRTRIILKLIEYLGLKHIDTYTC